MANVFAMLDEPETKELVQKSFSFESVFDGVEICIPDQLNFEQEATQSSKGVQYLVACVGQTHVCTALEVQRFKVDPYFNSVYETQPYFSEDNGFLVTADPDKSSFIQVEVEEVPTEYQVSVKDIQLLFVPSYRQLEKIRDEEDLNAD